MLRSTGAAGTDAGGGGAGGVVVVAAPSITGSAAFDVTGGTGGAAAGGGGAGGAGADGFALTQLGAGEVAGAMNGPSVDLEPVPLVTDQPTLTLSGRCEPDASIAIADVDGGTSASTVASATGAWTAEVTLAPGLNRLGVTATGTLGELRSWTGTNIEFRMRPGMLTPLPERATVDVVYVP
jgi:hypothetical protein